MKTKRKSFLITDGTIEFVSLVSNGANRTPFKVIKSEEGGKGMSKKVVQRVIVPKSIDADAAEKILEGFRTDEVEDTKSYKSYIQVPIDVIKEDSIQLAKIEDGAYMVVAEFAEGKGEDLTEVKEIEDTKKEELEWTTLDDIFTELYALEGILSGTLRQKGTKNSEKASVILKAVDDFKIGLDIALSVIKYDEDSVPEPSTPKKEDKGLTVEDVKAVVDEAVAPLNEALDTLKGDLEKANGVIETMNTEATAKAEESKTKDEEAAAKAEELNTTIETLKEEIAVLKKQPSKKQSDGDDDDLKNKKTTKTHSDDFYSRRF